MSFKVGDMVWIGWCPSQQCSNFIAQQYRCVQGEIVNLEKYDSKIQEWKWRVNCNGKEIVASESILIKIDPDQYEQTDEEPVAETASN